MSPGLWEKILARRKAESPRQYLVAHLCISSPSIQHRALFTSCSTRLKGTLPRRRERQVMAIIESTPKNICKFVPQNWSIVLRVEVSGRVLTVYIVDISNWRSLTAQYSTVKFEDENVPVAIADHDPVPEGQPVLHTLSTGWKPETGMPTVLKVTNSTCSISAGNKFDCKITTHCSSGFTSWGQVQSSQFSCHAVTQSRGENL